MAPLGYEAGEASEPVWTLWRRKYFPQPGIEPFVIQSVDLPLYSVVGCDVVRSRTTH